MLGIFDLCESFYTFSQRCACHTVVVRPATGHISSFLGRRQPSAETCARRSVLVPGECRTPDAAGVTGRATEPRAWRLTMGAYVQAVRWELLARDGCCVLDAANR